MARNKKSEFRGRIIPSNYDFQTAASDVVGFHHVLYPKSRADVSSAVNLSQGQKTFVRSGIQVSKQDVVDGTGGIVINLGELANVKIKMDEVKAEAAATSEVIAEQLAEHSLALPLSDNPLKSIASNVLFEGPSYLMRSLGSLSDYVSKIRAVKPNGRPAIFQAHAGASNIDRCRASNAIITQVEFKAVPAKSLWMFQKTCPYPGRDHFLEIARILFLKTKLSERTDLVLDAYIGRYNIPIMRITALGFSRKGKLMLKNLLEKALTDIGKDFQSDIVHEECSGSEVLDVIADSEFGAALDPTIDSERLHRVVEAGVNFDDFLIQYAEEVQIGVAMRDDGEGKLNEDVNLFSRLQVNRDNGLEISGYVYTPNLTIEYPLATRLGATSFPTSISLALESTITPIPNFKGEVYEQKDRGYKSRAKQYATSSYKNGKTTPFMVAYPCDKDDILAAIAFAKTNNKHIVARSGGHQYSGKSSGDTGTIVLSMDAFNHLKISRNIVEVGPAIQLSLLAKRFKRRGITIPHGECPKVAIGGHVQTGGYGHLLRSFGLLLDYVKSFDIVLGDESQRTVTRPLAGISPQNAEEELNKNIFWGVLGGNAGSFGIITNYRLEFIKDSDYPNSNGFSKVRRYKENIFQKLMKEVQKWTKKVEDGTLPSEIDFMMTVESRGRMPLYPVMIVELVHSNKGRPGENVDGVEEICSVIKAVTRANSKKSLKFKSGQKDLSTLSDDFVRRWPATTLGGREFRYPYKKRVNCTMKALTDDFIKKLVKMITYVVKKESGVKLVFQMSIGGGKYQNTERRTDTSIPNRDYVFCFVFDLFYKKNHEETANKLQRQMQNLIDAHFNNGQERRVFWGTFSDTDISKEEIRKMYYDSKKQYTLLQELKKIADPDDVLHTGLTVQLPNLP